MRISVFAGDLGWLFEDLKAGFARLDVPSVAISVGEQPCDDADAWVAIRTVEAASTPDPVRTVVCLHDLYDDPALYLLGGPRGGVHHARSLVLCHPDQRALLLRAGVRLDDKILLERPLGPLRIFRPRRMMPAAFTVGWVGRNDRRKRLEWVQAIAECPELDPARFRFMLVGRDLDDVAVRLRARGFGCDLFDRDAYPIAAYPALYERMDCLLITSTTEAGPLTLFEALATGVPVVSSPVGWAPILAARSGEHVMIGETPEELARHLRGVHQRRDALFAQRAEIASIVGEWTLDGWFRDVIDTAVKVGKERRRSGLGLVASDSSR